MNPLVAREIDFVELIQNALSVAAHHRDKLWRVRLSLITPLSDQLVKQTKRPIFGPRATGVPRKSLAVFQPVGSASSSKSIAISGANGFKSEFALLQEFQKLHYFLLSHKPIPKTQIPRLMVALSKNPVISITLLATEANISRDTAKRWLRSLEQSGKLKSHDFNGMKQFAYSRLLEILEQYVRDLSKPY